ncbi:MAG: hypothetical protein LBG65_07200 [Puniceicoccales bacterium]|nr:hypothetical protein [Puniceicoccales bacterium]
MIAAGFACGCGGQGRRLPVPQDIIEAGIPVRDLSQSMALSAEPLAPKPFAMLDRRSVPECSGFAVSQRHPGVIWTHSDSDNPATIVAIRPDGTMIKPANAPEGYRGITVKGVRNLDWEACVVTSAGEFILGDIGNNDDKRRDLRLLVFPEPDPFKDTEVTPRIFPVRHRDQRVFKPRNNKHYDCEAMFAWGGELYFFTKRWSDTWTVLCKLEAAADTPAAGAIAGGAESRPHGGMTENGPPAPASPATPSREIAAASLLPPNARSGILTPVGAFDACGLVTDAAISPDGSRLAVLTYHNIWLFSLPAPPQPNTPDAPISGKAVCLPLRFPLEFWQAEALAFDGEDCLLVGSEQGALFRIPIPAR